MFDRSVFVDVFSLSPPILSGVDCGGGSSRTAASDKHSANTMCVTWGLSVCVCVYVSVCEPQLFPGH